MHRDWARAYGEVKRLRDFLAHNMGLSVLKGEEQLVVTTFHGTAFRAWSVENPSRLDLAYMTQALQVAEWLLDVVVWTTWRLGYDWSDEVADSAGVAFGATHAPPFEPPHALGVPERQ